MALSAAGLKAEIISELDAVAPTADAANGDSGASWRDQFAEAVSRAVINYLKDNAEVSSAAGLPVAHPMGPGKVLPYTLPAGSALK